MTNSAPTTTEETTEETKQELREKFPEKQREELLKNWVAALRSGKYKQGRGALKSGDRYCCLGVLCDISKKGEWSQSSNHDARRYGYRLDSVGEYTEAYLPYSLNHELGITIQQEGDLAKMNDSGALFSTIADYIEQTLLTKETIEQAP